MTQSVNTFAFDLYKTHYMSEYYQKQRKDNNIFISPLSASFAIAIGVSGSTGSTEEQLKTALGFKANTTKDMEQYYQKLHETLPLVDPNTQYVSANSLWINSDFSVKSAFISATKEYYGATSEVVDFSKESTVTKINKWCANKTAGKMPSIIQSIDSQERMILLNALYFKGNWTTPFGVGGTTSMNFKPMDGDSVKVDMMHMHSRTIHFQYCENEILQILELPFGSQSFVMDILLPKADVSFSGVVNSLSETNWNTWMASLDRNKVDIYIPKFTIKQEIDLKTTLRQMGVTDVFNVQKADFSNISDADLYIGILSQNTYISVDERGCEAAAATSARLVGAGLREEDPIFMANRPFIFVIREVSTGAILFIGQKG